MSSRKPRALRIALAGAHETGKSTLAEHLARAMPGYRVIEEPYHALEAEGQVFADPPTREDFEEQLRRSLADVATQQGAVVFDRSPLDHFAYLGVLGKARTEDSTEWFDAARVATDSLDLLVFVPIEQPDRIATSGSARLRSGVDAQLRAGLVEEEWGLAVPLLEVSGTVEQRVKQVISWIEARSLTSTG